MGTPATNKKEKEKQIVYPVFKMEEKGKLILPPHILSQITFLHSHIGKEEWSGMLLYDVIKGNPSKPEEFELEAKHIFLMDIGTAAYTEYEPDGDIVDIYDNIPEAMSWKTGHIHTHHHMGSYFSATDMSELNDNVDKHNYYLSLIVSFDGNFTAKVAFLSDMETTAKMNFKDDSGAIKNFRKKKTERHMVTIDMRIYFGELGGFFSERLKEVKKKAKEAEELAAKRRQYQYGGYGGYGGWNAQNQRRELPAHNQRPVDSKIIPDKMTSWEIEKLTRNVLMCDPELKAEGNVYKILHEIADRSDSDPSMEMYDDFLGDTVEDVIENYFDNPLEVDEFEIVMKEVIMCVNKYEAHVKLSDTVDRIVGVLTFLLNGYMEVNQREGDNNDIADQLEKMERELHD